MSAKLRIRKGDKVVVITGKDKGKQGEVLRVIPAENRAVVGGINISRRHTKQTASQDAGIFSKPAPIHLSNLMLIDAKTGKPGRVGRKANKEGELERYVKTKKTAAK